MTQAEMRESIARLQSGDPEPVHTINNQDVFLRCVMAAMPGRSMVERLLRWTSRRQ
jgi:hypothetical protein